MKRTFPCAVVLCSWLILASTSLAAGYSKTGKGGGSGNGGGGNTPPPPPPVDRSASIQSRKDLTAAGAAVNQAGASLASTVAILRREFEKTPEWVSAQAAVKSAKAALDLVAIPAMEALAKRPDYKAAKTAKENAEAARDALGPDPKITVDDRQRAATAVFDAKKAVTKLETDAMDADPKVVAAQAKLAAANALVATVLSHFDESVKQNAEWQAGAKTLDEKKQAQIAAQKTLADALAKEAVAERERQKQIAQGR